jgi:hypothetical protein
MTIFNKESPINIFSVLLMNSCMKNGSVPSVLNIQHNRMRKKEKYIQMAQSSPHAGTTRIAACLHVMHMRVWNTAQWMAVIISCKFNILNLEAWVESWNSAVSLIHTHHLHYYILSTDEEQFIHDRINTIKFSLWDYKNVWGTVVSSNQHNLSVLWCGIVREHLTETSIYL